jgi:hypothetical protein
MLSLVIYLSILVGEAKLYNFMDENDEQGSFAAADEHQGLCGRKHASKCDTHL